MSGDRKEPSLNAWRLANEIVNLPSMRASFDLHERRRQIAVLVDELLPAAQPEPKTARPMDEMASLRVLRLEAAIRKHRDYRGDDRCHMDDGELYEVLPEGAGDADTRQLEPAQMLLNCIRFIGSRHDPAKPYLTSPTWVAEVMAERIAQDKFAGGPAFTDEEPIDGIFYALERLARRGLVTSGAELRSWLVRIAATAIAGVESFDRRTAHELQGIAALQAREER